MKYEYTKQESLVWFKFTQSILPTYLIVGEWFMKKFCCQYVAGG